MMSETCYLVCPACRHGRPITGAPDALVFKQKDAAEKYADACRNNSEINQLPSRYVVFPLPIADEPGAGREKAELVEALEAYVRMGAAPPAIENKAHAILDKYKEKENVE